MNSGYAVVIGLDVGKSGHHACALDPDGKKLFDKPLPQDETKLRELFTQLQNHGEVLMVVDQPNTIGALPIAVARDVGCAVAYLPGLAMRKAADLAHETTRALNRIRSLLTQIHPALERVFVGGSLATGLVLDLLEKFSGPTGLKNAGRSRVLRFARSHSRRDPEALIDRIFAALGEQTVVVPATAAVELVIPRVACQVKELKEQRATVAQEVEAMLEDFPLAGVLMSMPGIGIKTAAQILLNIGDGSAFETPGHLAAYAGIAPVTRRSGTSIRGEFPARSGNKRLKNALFYSAWVATRCDPISKAYYDRKRAEGKRHNAAVICLARRRCNVIFAMLRDGTYYHPPSIVPTHEPAALAA